MRRLLVVIALLATCCGIQTASAPPSDGGNGGADGGGADGQVDGGTMDAPPPNCTVSIDPRTSQPYYSGPGRAIQFDAVVAPDSAGPFTFRWQTTNGTIDPNPDASAIVRTPTSGTYTVTVQTTPQSGAGCTASRTVLVFDGPSTILRLRFTPSAGALPRQEVELSLIGDTLAMRSFALDGQAATLVTLPLGSSAYVRMTEQESCLATETWIGGSAAAAVSLQRASDQFDVLVIPDGADFAPMRTTARRRDLSAPGYPLDLLRGAPVSGSVTQAGAPLAGARVELTSASAPSSLGRTDAAGAWQVRASAGQSYGVVVAAAATTALPVAEVADTLVAIDAAGNAPAVSFDYDPITTHRLGGQVVLASGEAAGRSRVHVTARPLARVGLLTIGGGAPVPVGGHFRRDLSTDNAGQLAPIDLPAAVYDVLIEPPAGAGQARTRLVLDLLAADRPAERLVLAAPVLLSGRVVTSDTPAYPLAGTPVTVVERGATAVFAVLTDGDGRFQVAVDPAASYDVSATPRVPTPLPTELWARVRVQADVGAGDLELPDLLAPLGKLASGRVTDGSGSPLAGTLVEAFVGACSPGQPAAAEATTDSTGSFRVIVPAAPTTSAPAARRPRLR